MTGVTLIAWASLIALIILGAAMVLGTVRIIIGPSLGDRVLALDLLTNTALGFVATFAIRTGLMLYLDIAIALGLLGFLATLAFARYMLTHAKLEQEP
ncbi:cation:proton antiporter [Devosia algicola]|uniref:Cation:proton antiporter n=1 Tax=Devosia algicola TaxID=3026418 RepID=A0ABY7YNT2_9HYPH|nr:cation:proton antiporter [Devosia algicola]WDR02725.1 cation:proton antiporter [Devosia algicola]